MSSRGNEGKADTAGMGLVVSKSPMDDLLRDLHDPVCFQGYNEAMALAFYVKARFGARPYQKDASWKPLLRFNVRAGEKVSTDVTLTVFFPNGKEYQYVRFSMTTCNRKGITQRFMPLTLDQAISLIQEIQNPYSYANRLTSVEQGDDLKSVHVADA